MISELKKYPTFKFLFIVQVIILVWIFTCIFMVAPLYAYLLPFLIFQILIYIFLFLKIHRAIFFFLLLLPFCGIGFLPTFYREIFVQGGVLFIVGLFLAGQFLLDERERLRFPKDFPVVPFLVLLIVSFVSLVFNAVREIPGRHLFRFTFLFWQFLAFLAVIPMVLRRKEEFLKAIHIFLASLVFACLCLTSFIISGLGAGKIFVTLFILLNLNAVAMVIAPFIPLTIGLSLDPAKKSTRILLYVCLFVIIATLLLTRSIGAYLGTLFGVFYVICATKSYRWFIGFPILMVPIFLMRFFRDVFLARLGQTSILELTLLQRFKLWQTAIPMIRDNFLFGVGFSNFTYYKFQYGFPGWLDPNKIFHTHNLYLEILVGMGIFGIVSFIWFFAALIRRLSQVKDTKSIGIRFGMIGAMIVYFTHGLFDWAFWFPPTFLILALLGGLTLALINCEKS